MSRVAPPIALMVFLFSCLAVAQDTPPQPRKASVVMPLLKELSPKDSPESIDQQITRILGDKYFEMGARRKGMEWGARSK
jgi:hypothetical protein